MTEGRLYLTAKQAAAELGISVNSLYAYVSRKGLRTRPMSDRKGSLYWAEDVRRLAEDPDRTTNRLVDGKLVDTTTITLLTSVGPYYRGRSSLELAKTATFEETAAILWDADPGIFATPVAKLPSQFAAAREAVSHLSTIDQAVSLLPLFEHANPQMYDLSLGGYHATGLQVLRLFAALLVGDPSPSETPIHELIAKRMGREELTDVVRQLLVLFADHELAPSTYVVRAAANTGATPIQAIIAGLGSARGRRIIAGRTYAIRRFIDEIVQGADPERSVMQRVRDGEPLPGFGDGIYKGRDGRAEVLLAALAGNHADRPEVQCLLKAVNVAREVAKVEPDFVVLFLFIERELGFPHNDGAIGLLGRLAGWIAHAAEQYHGGPMVRFGAAYTGPLPSIIDADHQD